LEEAKKHKSISKNILADIHEDTDKDVKRDLKQQAKAESREYSSLKKALWTLLMNSNKLSENRSKYLNEILDNHHDLAVCYAMKEEMCELFSLTDVSVAEMKWSEWFAAAKEINIPARVNFAELKEKRIPGLVAHAVHRISTGKLEGFNNKIKVAKRIAYGYRDEDFFFSLIRYLSLPSVRAQSPNFP
jgi:transposase